MYLNLQDFGYAKNILEENLTDHELSNAFLTCNVDCASIKKNIERTREECFHKNYVQDAVLIEYEDERLKS